VERLGLGALKHGGGEVPRSTGSLYGEKIKRLRIYFPTLLKAIIKAVLEDVETEPKGGKKW